MAYRVHLAQFEGPLDLLLHLIREAELDIKDIFVSEITAQYMAYMRELDSLDMDMASEFLAMAATLLYIKSRQLLPRPPREDAGEEDPETVLIRQLQEYQAFKEASAGLSELRRIAGQSYTRLPEDVPLPPRRIELDGATLDNLYAAFSALLSRLDAADGADKTHTVRPDAYSVRSQMRKIREILLATPSVRFEALFLRGAERMEIVVTFMALLEMLGHGEIGIRQKAPFAPLRIQAKALLLHGDEDYAYMDEMM